MVGSVSELFFLVFRFHSGLNIPRHISALVDSLPDCQGFAGFRRLAGVFPKISGIFFGALFSDLWKFDEIIFG
jgi:hypothetical protein